MRTTHENWHRICSSLHRKIIRRYHHNLPRAFFSTVISCGPCSELLQLRPHAMTANPTPDQTPDCSHDGHSCHLQDCFTSDVDPHCATPCQFWYTPACTPDAASLFR